MKVFVVNTGSSSIKWSFYDEEEVEFFGSIERIGHESASFFIGKELYPKKNLSDHKNAFDELINCIGERVRGVDAICHRIVHGGRVFKEPTLLTFDVLEVLKKLIPLAPEHMPFAIFGIEAFQKVFKGVQIGCFDTGFHAGMWDVAKRLPIPKELDDSGVCRFGFHGLSYEYVVEKLFLTNRLKRKVVIAHLGNGCSLAAVLEGKGVDTTMGMTPLGGVPMGRRSGDLDPGVLLYLMREKGYDEKSLNEVLNQKSGLLGVSGISSDMRDLLESSKIEARFAVEFFCYQVAKSVGALSVALSGLETLVFTGGIGERSQVIRDKICERLKCLGPFEVLVIPTNEELMMVKKSQEILKTLQR
jgi:acetate kinase